MNVYMEYFAFRTCLFMLVVTLIMLFMGFIKYNLLCLGSYILGKFVLHHPFQYNNNIGNPQISLIFPQFGQIYRKNNTNLGFKN